MKTFRTKLIVLCMMISTFSIMAQEQDSWWQTDGSLRVENAEHTFTTPIVRSNESIKENEMLLVNLSNYKGEDQEGIEYGIFSKDLSSGEATELKVYHRRKIDSSNPNAAPNFGFDFTNNNYLIYGCKTSTDNLSSFTNQENPWAAYGYYAHGYSFSKTQIKSTDYKHLWNRPKSATWWDTVFDITVGVVIVLVVAAVSIVTFGGADALFAVLGGIYASISGVATLQAIVGFLALSSVFTVAFVNYTSLSYHSLNSSEQELQLIPQKEFETNMELPVPHKIDNPESDAQINWNKSIDTYLTHSFDCTDFPSQKCFRAPFREVVVKIKVKNSHIKHVNIPGAIHKNITPYQLFKNYQYSTDKTGEIVASSIEQEDIRDASQFFDSKVQILPRSLVYASSSTTTEIALNNYEGVPTYYLASKEAPDMHDLFYSDLGVYGHKDGHEYRLYRFQSKIDAGSIAITTGPEGPFLVGDNIHTESLADLTISVFRSDDVTPVIEEGYSFTDNSTPQIHFQAGDSVVFTSKHADFSLEGIPEIWLARAAGESKYYCTPSVKPNEYKPFLGYDSQVHGVAVRKHPTPDKKKTPAMVHDEETGLYSWYWIAQRRMDSNITDNRLLANQNVTFQKYKTATNLGNAGGFPIGGGIKVQKQRNNQREGYNMQLLYAWKTEGQSAPVFQEYGGPDFILGTDPDEIIYLGSNGAKIPSGHPDVPIPQALLKIDVEEWKRLQEGEDSDPINEMVTAYIQNRNYVDGNNTEVHYNGYEILDKGMYREFSIPEVTGTKPCNGKPCVKFFQDGIAEEDDNHKAPGVFTFGTTSQESQLSILVDLVTPQNTDNGFYGSIEGDQWPSEWQKNVPYSFTGLAGLSDEVLNTLVMEYSYENELGILTKDTRYFRDGGAVSNNGKWTENFNLKGWGYNEITVYVQRKPNATMVPIAGMELLEVMLRFLSTPGSKWKDFSPSAFDGVDLAEGRGEGNYWYLRDANADLSNNPIYGKPIDDINKSYTFSKNDRVIFTVMDSDPHTFFHYDVEWYLSERFMAKRLFPNDLKYRIHWFLAPADYEGLGDFIHKGRWLDKTFDKPGKYRLTAVYGLDFDKNDDNYNHTRMSHEITVMPNTYSTELDANKGVIDVYPLSSDQISWLKEKEPEVNISWRVAEVDNIFSRWTHIDGPRAVPPNDKSNRYGLENDYNAHFEWYQKGLSHGSAVSTEYSSSKIDDTNLDWFPSNWIRHYSGNDLPNDMDISLVSGGITSTPSGIDAVLGTAFPSDTPEPWQWRLPWVSLTNWQGYRTRANIKVVFNMNKLFHNQTGAFSGLGLQNISNEQYEASVSNPIPQLTDQRKSKYDFYLDLLSGRKIVYDPSLTDPANLSVHQVDDTSTDSNDIVIVNPVDTGTSPQFLKGADMSIVKNLEDEGITWTKSGIQTDPYEILSYAGANVVRFRLWVNPEMTDGSSYNYSTLESVTSEIVRAKNRNLQVILDFHYSDTWADPKQNIIPASWSNISTLGELETRFSTYTTNVLQHLSDSNALPDIVQIGNEINGNLLLSKPYNELSLNDIASELGVNPQEMNGNKHTINWDRNARLLNAGLSSVRDFSSDIKTMLHLAGPVFAQHWLHEAFNQNVSGRLGTAVVNQSNVDIIGLSYYLGEPEQQQSISTVKQVIQNIGYLYNKEVLIVETAFPHTYGYSDRTNNLYGETSRGAWPESTGALEQLEWLITLRETLKTTRHSIGFVYWEPFWVGSNTAQTKDFRGSNWENMSFFSFSNGTPSSANELELNGGINVFSRNHNISFNQLECTEEAEIPYQTSFETDFGGWSHGSSNDFDWSRHSGPTSSITTGPSYANEGRYYLYTEASYPNYSNKNAILVSPCFDLTKVNSPSFSFYYHMYGNGVGNIKLEVTTNDDEWETLWNKEGDQGNNWLNATVNLSSYQGTYIKLRFSVITGADWRGDIAIDNLYLVEEDERSERGLDCQMQNIATDGTATQSNTAYGGLANRAIDGNTNGAWHAGSVTHTVGGEDNWWEVTLAQASEIDTINIYNRTDCCSDRLSNYTVEVYNDQGEIVFSESYTEKPNNGIQSVIANSIVGRKVRISSNMNASLSLAEVQVMSCISNNDYLKSNYKVLQHDLEPIGKFQAQPNSTSDEFQIYPNPTSDQLIITFPDTKNNTVELIDLQGRILYQNTLTDTDRYVLSTQELQIKQGIIFVRLSSDLISTIKKVIIK